MSFTITEFRDLIQLLSERPEWRAELRQQILDDDFLRLPQEFRDLAAAQARTEAALTRLAIQMQELTERVDRLAEGQARLIEGQARLERRVDGLAEGQARLTEGQTRLERRVDGLATAFGELSRAVGSTVEEEAEGVLMVILKEKGYRLLGDPYSLRLNGEIDVILEAETPDKQRIWAVVEAKARLGRRQVTAWGQKVRSSGWQKRMADANVPGPYLVYAHGIRVDRGAREAAAATGIGLMNGQGERIAPQGLIEPS